MKKSEIATLLARMAAFDRRTVGEADVEAWADALDDEITLADAAAAVREHHRRSTDWLMPVHVITLVRAMRRARLQAAGTPPIPGGLAWAQERAWRQLWCAAVKDGDPDPAATASAAMGVAVEELLPADPGRVERLRADLAAGLPAIPGAR